MESYEVFVRWKRGDPPQHARTITAPDDEMALLHAKRNIDLRSEPIEIWVAPRRAITKSDPDDETITPTTDREYRMVQGYAARPSREVE